jgi:hypothetical protein
MCLYKKEHVGTLILFDEMRENPMCLHRIPTKLKQYIVQQLNEKKYVLYREQTNSQTKSKECIWCAIPPIPHSQASSLTPNDPAWRSKFPPQRTCVG